jgi:hypothetical protein
MVTAVLRPGRFSNACRFLVQMTEGPSWRLMHEISSLILMQILLPWACLPGKDTTRLSHSLMYRWFWTNPRKFPALCLVFFFLWFLSHLRLFLWLTSQQREYKEACAEHMIVNLYGMYGLCFKFWRTDVSY